MFLLLISCPMSVPTATPTLAPTECPVGEKKLKTEVKKRVSPGRAWMVFVWYHQTKVLSKFEGNRATFIFRCLRVDKTLMLP